MPWRETCVMDEKVRFVAAASEEEAVMSELCAEFGISRQTGYKWLQRKPATLKREIHLHGLARLVAGNVPALRHGPLCATGSIVDTSVECAPACIARSPGACSTGCSRSRG